MNLSTRLDILRTLACDIELKESERDAVLKLVDEAFELNTHRNWLLHDPWASMEKLETGAGWLHGKRRMRPKKDTREWQSRKFTADEIRSQTIRCIEAARSIYPLLNTLSEAREAQRENDDRRTYVELPSNHRRTTGSHLILYVTAASL